MSDEKKNQNIDKYAEDLATIKSLLMDVDKRPFLEYWAFFTWGGLVLIGTLIHYWLRTTMDYPEPKLFLYVWLPVFIIAISFETLAWFTRMSKESMSLLNQTTTKMFVAMGGVMTAMGLFLVITVKGTGYSYVPHIVVAMFGIFMLFFVQFSYNFYFGIGYLLVMSAVVLYLLPLPKDVAYLVSGLVLGFTFLVAGELNRRAEKEDQ